MSCASTTRSAAPSSSEIFSIELACSPDTGDDRQERWLDMGNKTMRFEMEQDTSYSKRSDADDGG